MKNLIFKGDLSNKWQNQHLNLNSLTNSKAHTLLHYVNDHQLCNWQL